eukprot:Skav204113  [mRNA]  locus=scaffold5190:73946:76672:- [translate_table: standard]
MARTWNAGRISSHGGAEQAPVCMTGDVTDDQVWNEILQTDPQVFTISSSCKSFSTGGAQAGWTSRDGQTLALTLLRLSRHGARFIVFENVPAIKEDKVLFTWLEAVLDFCGLTILAMGTFGISSCHPADRVRFLMVLKQKDDATLVGGQECDPFARFRESPKPNLWTAKRWVHLPEALTEQCMVDRDLLQQYLSPPSMTQHMKAKIFDSSMDSKLQARCTRATETMAAGTIMANYGKQHEILTVRNPKIYGYLKRTGEREARFFHSTEIALSMGFTNEIILPRQEGAAKHAVGNSISECHALIIMCHGLNLWRVVCPWIPEINIPDMIKQHAQDCLTTDTMLYSWTEEWVTITKKTATGQSSGGQIGSQNLDATEIDSSCSSEVASDIVPSQGSKRKLLTVATEDDQELQMPFKVMCSTDATVLKLIVAESQLHPSLSHVSTKDVLGEALSASGEIQADQILLGRVTNDQDKFQGSILVTDDYAGISLQCLSHERLSEWSFKGKPFSEYKWCDSLGMPMDPTHMIGFRIHATVDMNMDLQPPDIPYHVKVVRIHNKQITVQVIKHGHNEDVESLLRAEQVTLGPGAKVVAAHDRFAAPVGHGRLLEEVGTVAVHIQDAHNLIEIITKKRGKKCVHWVARGTRVFQLESVDGMIIVDHKGCETPGDLPLFAPTTLQWLEHESEEESPEPVSPTIPFTVHSSAESEPNMTSKQFGLDLNAMIQQSTARIQQEVAQARNAAVNSSDPWQSIRRIRSLCHAGIPIADDEMTWILVNLEKKLSGGVVGIVQWSTADGLWQWNHRWIDAHVPTNHEPAVVMMYYQEHWIPLIWSATDKQASYATYEAIEHDVLRKLKAFMQIPEWTPVHHHVQPIHGTCGWEAILWIFDTLKLASNECTSPERHIQSTGNNDQD